MFIEVQIMDVVFAMILMLHVSPSHSCSPQREGGPVADPGDHVLRGRRADPAAAAETAIRCLRSAAQDKGFLHQAQQQHGQIPPSG